ncbi:MAG: phosphoribosylformylglycinamidine synthase subunit PurL [Caldivirga sp.]
MESSQLNQSIKHTVNTTLKSHEIKAIRESLGREPNEVELLIFEAEWSEHCSYKSSRRWLRELPSESIHVVRGPGLDAPLIKVGKVFISFKIESHNHPSAIDPYDGAATGVGGIVRDILTTGLRPIALLNNLHFGDPGDSHSLWIARGVVKGISDYGNRIGVPVVGGEVWFDESFARNPIVLITCLGVGVEGQVVWGKADLGDVVMVIGNDTGKDGMLGSSFASKTLGGSDEISAVQVGNPLLEKLLIDVITELAQRRLIKAIKDVGGGGLATALSELASQFNLGIRVYLDRIRLRDELSPGEILVSESQERMVVVVDPGRLREVESLLGSYGVDYDVIGELTEGGRFEVYYRGELVADLPVKLITGAPEANHELSEPAWLRGLWELPQLTPIPFRDALIKVLSSPNVASKEPIYTLYDHEVGVRTVIKPGQAGAAVLRVLEEDGGNGKLGLAIKADANPRYSFLDPYIGAANSLAKAYRNVVAVGGRPIAAVDSINVGNPELPDRYWYFVMSVKGLSWIAKSLGVPIVGGKVSFYNEDSTANTVIKPVVTVAMLGVLDDIDRSISGGLKGNGSLIVIGLTDNELGGSEYLHRVHGMVRGLPPRPKPEEELRNAEVVLRLIERGLVNSCMDIGLGGLAITLLKMSATGGVGFNVDLAKTPTNGTMDPVVVAFSETNARYVIETHHAGEVMSILREVGVPHAVIGVSGGDSARFLWMDDELASLRVSEVMGYYSSLWGVF